MKMFRNGGIVEGSVDMVVDQLSVLTGKKATLVREVDGLKVIRVGNEVYLYKSGILGVYDSVTAFKEGVAVVKKDGLHGYIDKDGNILVELKYVHARQFNNGRAVVGNRAGYGVIDKTGKLIVPQVYKSIKDYESKYTLAEGMFSGEVEVIDNEYNLIMTVRGIPLTGVTNKGEFYIKDDYSRTRLYNINGESRVVASIE